MLDVLLLIVLFIISLVVLTKGADFLVGGSSDFASYLKVSPILIGLTIVALGTSLPEFIVSFIAVLKGVADLSIGNIIGSNIANIGLVIGISALILPLAVKSNTLTYEFPFVIISSFLFVILANNSYIFNKNTYSLDWFDGIIFLVILGIFLFYVFKSMKHQKRAALEEFKKEYTHKNPLRKNILLMLGGLVMLVIGGRLFVESSTGIARHFGISEAFIGLTIVALGTSLPELFTCAVAAWKKEGDIVIGNILGSNIFNILFVLGTTSVFKTITINPMLLFRDSIIMILFSLVFLLFATVKSTVSRKEGFVLFAGYVAYIVYLVILL